MCFCIITSGLEINITATVNISKELTKTEQNASFIILYCVIHTSAINPSIGYRRKVRPCIAVHIVTSQFINMW